MGRSEMIWNGLRQGEIHASYNKVHEQFGMIRCFLFMELIKQN